VIVRTGTGGTGRDITLKYRLSPQYGTLHTVSTYDVAEHFEILCTDIVKYKKGLCNVINRRHGGHSYARVLGHVGSFFKVF
jgi:hypothetical protein